jgi:hypothetical protein
MLAATRALIVLALGLLLGGAVGAECGGPRAMLCESDELCSYSPPNQCGAEGQPGTCVKRPEVCASIFIPVCGCDGRNYSNQCVANAEGVSVANAGSCKKD